MPVEKVHDILALTAEPVSLDAPTGRDDEAVLADYVAARSLRDIADEVDASLRGELLSKGLATLSVREQGVVSLRYGLRDDRPRSFREIGLELGCSGEHARQIAASTLAKLAGCPELQRARACCG
jgi:RNA polymerase primary sigma factor